MINDFILFSPRYCSHLRTLLVLVPTIPIPKTKIISIATQQDFLPNQILKKSLAEKIDDFLKILENTLKKKTVNQRI